MSHGSYMNGAMAMRAAAVDYVQGKLDGVSMRHVNEMKMLAIPIEEKPYDPTLGDLQLHAIIDGISWAFDGPDKCEVDLAFAAAYKLGAQSTVKESDAMDNDHELKITMQTPESHASVPKGFVDMVLSGLGSGLVMDLNVTTPKGTIIPGEWVVRHQDNQRVWRVKESDALSMHEDHTELSEIETMCMEKKMEEEKAKRVVAHEEREDAREQDLREAREILDEAVTHSTTIWPQDLAIVLGHILDALDRPEPQVTIEFKDGIPQEKLDAFKREWDKMTSKQPGICVAEAQDPAGNRIAVGEWKQEEGRWVFHSEQPDQEKPTPITDKMIREGLGLKSRSDFLDDHAFDIISKVHRGDYHELAHKQRHEWLCERGSGRTTETQIEALKMVSIGKVVHIRGGTPETTVALNRKLSTMAHYLGMKNSYVPLNARALTLSPNAEIFDDHTYTEKNQ